MRYNPLWPEPTPTMYSEGRLNNPEIRPRIRYGRYEVRPRLDWTPPSPSAHVRPRSSLKGRISIPRKQKLRPRSPFKGLKVNRATGRKRSKYSPKARAFIARFMQREMYGKKVTPKKRGQLLAIAMSKARQKFGMAGVPAKRKKNQYTKKYYGPYRYSKSRRTLPSRLSRISKYRSYRKSATPGSLVKIYNKTDQIFASGSVNSGSHGVRKTDKFTHKFSSKPGIFGVPKTGRYTLPAGALVIKGPKKLFKQFGSKELSFRSSRKLRSRSSRRSL